MIRDTITLDADPDLFLGKTLDDISFADSTFGILLESLEQNNHLIEREGLLEQLAHAERLYSQVLQELLENSGNFSVRDIPSIREKIIAFQANSLKRRKTAERLHPFDENIGNIYVSSDEISELLKAF